MRDGSLTPEIAESAVVSSAELAARNADARETGVERGTEDDFYRSMWSSDYWGEGHPNDDERIRLCVIKRLVEKHSIAVERRRLRILDVGCGRGWLTNELSRYGDVQGIDPVPASVERARQLFPDLKFEACDGDELLAQLGGRNFDLVVSSEVIEHVPNPQKPGFVAAIYNLLDDGGTAILTTPRGELYEQWKAIHPNGQPVEDWISESDLDVLLTSSGLAICERDRAFLPGVRYASFLSRALAHRHIRRRAWLLDLPLMRSIRHRCSIYQIVAAKRVASMNSPQNPNRDID